MLYDLNPKELDKLYEDQKKYKELRKTSRQFIRAISCVPMRAIDCDQDEVDRLQRKLEELSGYRG